MQEIPLVSFHTPGMTGRQAMDQFARTHWVQPRRVGGVKGLFFFLIDGTVWYRAVMLSDGWQIVRTDKTTEDLP